MIMIIEPIEEELTAAVLIVIKPLSLQPGNHIGVISPSYWLNKKSLAETSKLFQDHGYPIIMGKSNTMKWGPFAGHPQDRADDIHRMFSDPNIKAIICTVP